jgi:transglutaminase-like putative cysteine protease
VAHEVTAATADPPPSRREQAERLERWVREHVHYSGSGVGLATAGQTFRSRDGDCTENAFLLTALMRAAGIPARVVVGLVYAGGGGSGGGAEEKPRPALVPHAWVEAHLEDGWRAFDSAVYSSPVDATHLAMAKSAGQEEGALLEVTVPLLSALGHFDLEWVDLTPPAAGR